VNPREIAAGGEQETPAESPAAVLAATAQRSASVEVAANTSADAEAPAAEALEADGSAAARSADEPEVDPEYAEEEPEGRRRSRRSRRLGWPIRVVASTALLLLAVSWLPPYLALRAENAALAASSDGDVAVALDRVRWAATLDPLAVSPLLTEASLLQQLGRNREALARLQAAAKLQPQNYEVWYELGVLLHGAFGRDKAARAALTRALALNPDDAPSRYELERLAR
jgi:tetratricopeptide (TPR) repeat protein